MAELGSKPTLMKYGPSVTKTCKPSEELCELLVEMYPVIIKTQVLY